MQGLYSFESIMASITKAGNLQPTQVKIKLQVSIPAQEIHSQQMLKRASHSEHFELQSMSKLSDPSLLIHTQSP